MKNKRYLITRGHFIVSLNVRCTETKVADTQVVRSQGGRTKRRKSHTDGKVVT